MNDWLLGIGCSLLEVKAEVFSCALTSGQAPSFGRPPAHPSCGELDGLFLAGVWLSVLYIV
ncbi:MAG: hypothetical protein K8953_11620 [Proteobacteria bacterium]|nr:hypothetical protein [Pseudomonadota bacterium]